MKNFRTMALLMAFVALLAACKKNKEAEQATPEVNAAVMANEFEGLDMCTELYPEGVTARGATERKYHWPNGSKIKVSLNGGTAALRKKVVAYASDWERYANIDFQFVTNDKSATIRVGFAKDGHWSVLGTYARQVASGKTTMNLGLTSSSSDTEISRVTLHEFGHALGMIHEHSHPLAAIPWDKPKVYAYYAGPPNNWSKAEVDFNLFEKYSKDQTNFSAYDKSSIMHYPVDEKMTIGTYSVGWNTVLSATDKTFIASVYPK